MKVAEISKLGNIDLSLIEMVRQEIGESGFERVSSVLDNIVDYIRRARSRGMDESLIEFNVRYQFTRIYAVTKAKNEGDRENVARALIKQIVSDDETRNQLYVELFDKGGVHEPMTVVKRPA